MKEAGIGVYYIPMGDLHCNEYVSEHFKEIKFVSGFSGSAGQLIITESGAWLYADGRYWIQAEHQLEGSGIELVRYGSAGTVQQAQFIALRMKELYDAGQDIALGFNGDVVSASESEKIINAIADECRKDPKEIKTDTSRDLAGEIWPDRPAQVFTPLYCLDIKYTGQSTASKLSGIRGELYGKLGRDDYELLINSLDDIAWIFNVRAADIPNEPVPFAFARITSDEAVLYVKDGCVPDEVRAELAGEGVITDSYSPDCLRTGFRTEGPAVMEFSKMGRSVYDAVKASGRKVIDLKNPSTLMKAVKNDTELECTKAALLRDSAVVTRFMYMIKQRAKATEAGDTILNEDGTAMSELTVDEWLTSMRKKDPAFIDLSFDTIAAYGSNAAMMHYQAKPESFAYLKAEGMLLVDSGVHDLDGTTDITRTFVLGPVSDEEKKAFTLTAVSMLRLADAVFIEGCSGENLDVIAREPMWKCGWDYKCGTGHGVGHILSVHEGPHCMRYRALNGNLSERFVPGMIVTDEPGVYREGRYGIRTENELVCRKWGETGDGSFLCFEHMTFIPIDLDGIDENYLNEDDRRLLNAYHKKVYEKLSGLLNEEEALWLKEHTREI